jgi:hypothetical protein
VRLAFALLLLLPAAAAAQSHDGLDPLYRRIAADLRQGKLLVATVHVALCDNRVIWCGRLGDGDRPERNLYWGGAAGFTAWFNRSPGWRRIHRDKGDGKQVLERVVYRMQVRRPDARWRRLGVTKPFEVLLVGLAHRGVKIDVATRRFIHEVADGRGATLRLADGRTIGYGGKGHLVGYAGHNYLMEAELLGEMTWPRVTRREPLGYFALACLTARYYKTHLSRRGGARALLLTRSLMYPGAFTIDGLVRGVVAGEAQHQVYLRGVERYATVQKRPQRVIRAAFTHDADPRFVRRHGGVPRRAVDRPGLKN